MTDENDVLVAAGRRAAAMASRDHRQLRELLHPAFSWISHQGERFDLDSYLLANQGGSTTWHNQEIRDAEVRVVGDTAILRCTVADTVDIGSGEPEIFVMPMTQTWLRAGSTWLCLAGHAGPRLHS